MAESAAPSLSLQDHVVVVTGAGQGIGRVLARSAAAVGASVVIADIDEGHAAAVADEVKTEGGTALPVHVDVADGASCGRMAAAIGEEFGRVDGLINNAALFSTLSIKPFWEIEEDEWEKVIRVNLTGVWLVTKALLPLIRSSSKGSIVNIASGVIWNGRPDYAHYVASKAGVVGFTRGIARELGDAAIRANCITPGLIATEIPRAATEPANRDAILAHQTLKQLGVPESLVGPILFLLSPASAHMTGQALNVDGGVMYR